MATARPCPFGPAFRHGHLQGSHSECLILVEGWLGYCHRFWALLTVDLFPRALLPYRSPARQPAHCRWGAFMQSCARFVRPRLFVAPGCANCDRVGVLGGCPGSCGGLRGVPAAGCGRFGSRRSRHAAAGGGSARRPEAASQPGFRGAFTAHRRAGTRRAATGLAVEPVRGRRGRIAGRGSGAHGVGVLVVGRRCRRPAGIGGGCGER